MSFNNNAYLSNLAEQVRSQNPEAPIQFQRGILVMHANTAFKDMHSDSVCMSYDGAKVHAVLENNMVAITGTEISTDTDEQSLQNFKQRLGKLIGFQFK